jgi:hypothetical protein
LSTGKLEAVGVTKVVPDADVLFEAYRRSARMAEVQALLDQFEAEPDDAAPSAVPADLETLVRQELARNRTASWDDAVWSIACARASTIRRDLNP